MFFDNTVQLWMLLTIWCSPFNPATDVSPECRPMILSFSKESACREIEKEYMNSACFPVSFDPTVDDD